MQFFGTILLFCFCFGVCSFVFFPFFDDLTLQPRFTLAVIWQPQQVAVYTSGHAA